MYSFSIIIPVYNTENYLEECLYSILNQSYKSYEVLLIDDGSLDRSSVICDAFAEKDKRFKVFHQHNQGVSRARNFGILHTLNDYIIFIDSDDYIEPDYLEDLNSKILDEDLILNMGYIEFHNPKKKICRNHNFANEMIRMKSNHLNEILTGNVQWPNAIWNGIYRTEFVKNKNIAFDIGLRWAEDIDFFLQAVTQVEKWTLLEKYYYGYRITNENSAMHSENIELYRQTFGVWKKWFYIFKESEMAGNRKLMERISGNCIALLMNASKLPGKERMELYGGIKKEKELLGYNRNVFKSFSLLLYQLIGYKMGSKIVYRIYYTIKKREKRDKMWKI